MFGFSSKLARVTTSLAKVGFLNKNIVGNLGQGGGGVKGNVFFLTVSLFLNYSTNYNAAIQLNDDHLYFFSIKGRFFPFNQR